MNSTIHNAYAFLDSLIDYEKVTTYSYDAMKLGRMRSLLGALGNPQNAFQSIHVAGSRGKGSTCAMVYSILREAGYAVGLYTSPHLILRNERIRMGAKGQDHMIADEELASTIAKVKPVVEKLSKEKEEKFTFFEVFTALSFLFFKEKGVDIAVLEVGMGGRLDATNVVRPLISAITPISYDHTDKLGKTLTEIACEKAQILKKEALAVVSHQDAEPLSEIRRVAKEKGITLSEVSSSYSYHRVEKSEEGTHFDVEGLTGNLPNLFLPLLGEHQIRNALTAIAVCEALVQKGRVVSKESIRKGLSKVDWPGRFQIIAKNPVLVLDGAQNGASASALKETFLDFFKGRLLTLILGISANKEVEAVCSILCPLAETVIVTQARTVRAMSPPELKNYAARYSKQIEIIPSLQEALDSAREGADSEGVILVAGSLYLIGEALALLKNEEAEKQRSKKQRFFSASVPLCLLLLPMVIFL